ncbi:MAG: hypothetical protein EOP45_08580, partial [Sphingobacteriaceae bacterium]
MLYGATTINQLKVLMERYEKKRRVFVPVPVPGVYANTRSVGTLPKIKPAVGSPVSTAASNSASASTSASVDMSTIRCYNCFAYGHYQSGCTAPKRPHGSCFICAEVGHTRHSCPRKRKPDESPNAVAAAIQLAAEEEEVRRLAAQLNHQNLVSVAFYEQNKCTELISRFALFDSGSPISTIRKSYVPFVNDSRTLTKFKGMGNKQISMCGFVKCKFVFREHELTHDFLILPDEEAAVPLLVGRDLLKKMNIHLCQISNNKYSCQKILDLNKESKTQCPDEKVVSALKLFNLFKKPNHSDTEVPVVCKLTEANNFKLDPEVNLIDDLMFCEKRFESCINVVNLTDVNDLIDYDEVILMVSTAETDESKLIDIDKKLFETDADDLRSIIVENYIKIFDKTQKLSGYSMQIKLKNDTPVYSSPRRLSYKEKYEVQKTINELLEQGIIKSSNSSYASPIVLVRKKNGQLRMCVDYRALNNLTIKDRYPLPLIEDCLEYLGGKTYFSVLDMKNGFHNVPMHEESMHLTSFVTPMGQYEYRYMPFGLCNAPPVFQRIINDVLRPLIDKGKIAVYLDDINIATTTLTEHYEILTEVLRLLAEAGLQLNFEKCKFAYREVNYLGYCVNEKGIRPNDYHLKAIREYVMPTNARELQRCLGLFSYFRRFIYDFSRTARPLNQLIKKGAKFVWTDDCTEAFETLKNRLLEAPVLCIFDPRRETELHTDASTHGYGGMLLQKQDDNKFHPVAYYSKTTKDEETRYHSFELETLAIVNALERFKPFLDGIPFTVVTDCNSLVQTLDKKNINPRIARWTLGFQMFDFKVRHRKGEQMMHVDALSRLPSVCAVVENEVDLNIQIAQSRDETINELKKELEVKDVANFELENGLVFRM